MKIACIGYRDWALKIYDKVMSRLPKHQFLIVRSKNEYNEKIIREFAPDLVLFYGWSWIINEQLLKDFTCLMLHPSPLPKYRGGSPIQNQIIRGELNSKVTIFIMNEQLDAGDIIATDDLSLRGNIVDIFDRITVSGIKLTLNIIQEGYTRQKQDESQATYFNRRTPEESEITLQELQTMPAEFLYNKVRMLQDPYPNAFIKTVDGKKLFIQQVMISE